MKLNVIAHRKIWYTFSGALIVASIAAIVIFGLPFGIDFSGGSLLEVKFDSAPVVADVRQMLIDQGFSENVVQPSGESSVLVRLPSLSEEQHQQVISSFSEKFGKADELRFDSVGPVIGQELRTRSLWALALSLITIMIYVAWMFRHVSLPVASWKYGLITILTGFHDLIIPLGVFALIGRSQHFQVDTAFIAALLTIIGYSINDTIVVFDRTRENLGREGGHAFAEVVNKSVQQTFARSINTTLTTLLALVAIYFFGGETTRAFALALIIGIATGAYSSIFIASPLLVTWEEWNKKRAA